MRRVPEEIPKLANNSARYCPRTPGEIAKYLSMEYGTKMYAKHHLRFVRTGALRARILKTRYWLFEFSGPNGEAGWVVVQSAWWFFLPTSLTGTFGEPEWTPEEVLRKYHWTEIWGKSPESFDEAHS